MRGRGTCGFGIELHAASPRHSPVPNVRSVCVFKRASLPADELDNRLKTGARGAMGLPC
jgi:hypothetical protein